MPRAPRDSSEIFIPPLKSGGFSDALGFREAHPSQKSNATRNKSNGPKWQRLFPNITPSKFPKFRPDSPL